MLNVEWILILFLYIVLTLGWCPNRTIQQPQIPSGYLYSLTVSPNGKYFSTARSTGIVNFWHISNFSLAATYNFGISAYRVAYSKDNKYIVISGSRNAIDILNATTLTKIMSLSTATMGNPFGLDFSYDSQYMITVGIQKAIVIWYVSNWTVYLNISTPTLYFRSAKFAKNGKFVICGQYAVYAYDASGNMTFQINEQKFQRVTVSPDGQTFIAVNYLQKYAVQSDWYGNNLRNYSYPTVMFDCDYSTDSNFFATTSCFGEVYIYNGTNRDGSLLQTLNAKDDQNVTFASAIQFTVDSNFLIVGDYFTNKIVQYYRYSPYYHQNCSQICGDSVTWVYPCDNQLNVPYDGCDNDCNVMNDFLCNVVDGKSICSYTGKVDIKITDIKGDPLDEGKYILKVQIDLPLYAFQNATPDELKQLFSFDQKLDITSVVYDPITKTFSIKVNPKQDISSDYISIKYNPSVSSNPFLASGLKQQFNLNVNGGPILMNHYSPPQKMIQKFIFCWSWILMAFGWISWIFALLLRRLAGIEAMLVLQFSWISIMFSQSRYIPLFKSLYPLKFTSGYNIAVFNQDQFISLNSPWLSQFKISEKFLFNNYNLNFIILMISLVIYFIALVRYKIYKKQHLQAENQKGLIKKYQSKVKKHYQYASQFFMNCVVLNFLYFIITACIFFKQGQKSHGACLAIFILAFLIITFLLAAYSIDTLSFGYFVLSFKTQTFSLHHYYLYMSMLILSPSFMVLVPSESWSPGLPILLLMIYTLINKPYISYKILRENLRSAFNLFVMISFVGFRVYTQYIPREKLNSIDTYIFLLLLVLVGLSLVVIFSLGSILYWWYREKKGLASLIDERASNEKDEKEQKEEKVENPLKRKSKVRKAKEGRLRTTNKQIQLSQSNLSAEDDFYASTLNIDNRQQYFKQNNEDELTMANSYFLKQKSHKNDVLVFEEIEENDLQNK